MHQVPTTTTNTMATESASSQIGLDLNFSFSDCRRSTRKNVREHEQEQEPLSSPWSPFGNTNTNNNGNDSSNNTASIPIERNKTTLTAIQQHNQKMAQDEAEADYKDFVFFSRVVDGISRQNSLLQDGSYLKSTNQTLLDNIVKSRHNYYDGNCSCHPHPEAAVVVEEKNEAAAVVEDNHTHYYYPSKEHHHDLKIVTPTTTTSDHHHYHAATVDVLDHALDTLAFPEFDEEDEDEEGVFDFEL